MTPRRSARIRALTAVSGPINYKLKRFQVRKSKTSRVHESQTTKANTSKKAASLLIETNGKTRKRNAVAESSSKVARANVVKQDAVSFAKSSATDPESLLSKACAHLIRVEPRLKSVIEKHPCTVFSAESLSEEVNPFESLARGIIAQQVSGAAAASIKNKFVALFNDNSGVANADEALPFPTPEQVAGTSLEQLRTAGLSVRKAEYIKGLADKFASGELTTDMLIESADEDLIELLTKVRGLGRWSVEMFMCFSLKRVDVFSLGDLGLQRGMASLLGKDVAKLKAKGGKWKYMSEKDMEEYSAKFAPYRSIFMWYLWRVEAVNVAVLST